MLHFGVGLARGAFSAAVRFRGLLTGQILGVCPGQSQGSRTFLTLEQLGVCHTAGANGLSQFGAQRLVANNLRVQHASKVLRIVRRAWRARFGPAPKCRTQRSCS